MSERVVHVSDKVPGAVYIGRSMPRQRLKASPLANPYKIGTHGDRAEVLRLYAIYLRSEVRRGDPAFIDALIAARGNSLACWCRHDGEERHIAVNGCHGDIISRYLAQHTDEEIVAKKQAWPCEATECPVARESPRTSGERPERTKANGQEAKR